MKDWVRWADDICPTGKKVLWPILRHWIVLSGGQRSSERNVWSLTRKLSPASRKLSHFCVQEKTFVFCICLLTWLLEKMRINFTHFDVPYNLSQFQSVCTSDYFLCTQDVAPQKCHPVIGSAVYSAKDVKCSSLFSELLWHQRVLTNTHRHVHKHMQRLGEQISTRHDESAFVLTWWLIQPWV